MFVKATVLTALIFGSLGAGSVLAQSTQSTQATSPGQTGASNTIPQAPSGGAAGGGARGGAASGAPIDPARQAAQDSKAEAESKNAAGSVCKGC
jgi:hypothetical protein